MTEPDWPEREADMALIRHINGLTRAAADAATPDRAARAHEEAAKLMPAYAAATHRYNTAAKRTMAAQTMDGGCGMD